jgi:hypothetical protein
MNVEFPTTYGQFCEGGTVAPDSVSAQAAGFTRGEAISAYRLNWILREQGKAIKCLGMAMAGSAFHANREYIGTTPFGTNIGQIYLVYDKFADKFYCTVGDSSTSDCVVYDSDDAETWSAGVTIDSSLGATARTSQVCSNGTIICVAADNKAYVSTDLTVANINLTGNAFSSITQCRGMGYSGDDNLFVAIGTNGTDGFVETSSNGTTWTLRATFATLDPTGIAVANGAGTGRGIITFSDSFNTYWSDNMTSWTLDTSGNPDIYPAECHHLPCFTPLNGGGNLGLFIAPGSDAGSPRLTCSDNWSGGTWGQLVYYDTTALPADHVFPCDDFLVVQTAAGLTYQICELAGAGEHTASRIHCTALQLGTANSTFTPVLTSTSGSAKWRGGRGIFAYVNTSGGLVRCNYGGTTR